MCTDAGEVSLKLKSKSASGMAFKVEGTKDDKNTVSGKLESTYTLPSGIAFKETWKTNSVVTTEITAKNQVVKGSKLVFEAGFSPSAGLKSQTIKADYGAPKFYVDTKLVDYENLSAGAVFSYSNFLFGVSSKFSVAKGFKGYEAAVSYVDKDFTVTSAVSENGDKMAGSIFHKALPTVDAGVRFSYNRNSGDTTFDVAGAYSLDASTTLKAKIDKSLNLGLAYTQDLRQGVTLGLSANVNAASLEGDGHSLGLSLGLEAI